MRHLLNVFFSLALLGIVMYSCDPGDIPTIEDPDDLINYLDSLGVDSCLVGDTLMVNDLPANAQSYLTQNYPQDPVANVIKYSTFQDSLYQVSLSSGTVVLFDGMGDFLQAGNPATIDPDDLEDRLLDSLAVYFPDLDIEEVELEWSYNGMQAFEIEFAGDFEIYVFVHGSTICYAIDEDCDDDDDDDDGDDDDCEDHDDDDDYIAVDSLPANILQHLQANYPNHEIEECAEILTLCDSTVAYVIEIEDDAHDDEFEVVYDLSGTFLYEIQEYEGNLPQAIVASIQTNYPGFEAEDDYYLMTLPNGDKRYQVELENDSTDIELIVIFAEDGTVVCEREEDD
ncbi:MAG: PepSY-like domain-containing protein [Bacteroidota bacterium]